jgi:protein TonB
LTGILSSHNHKQYRLIEAPHRIPPVDPIPEKPQSKKRERSIRKPQLQKQTQKLIPHKLQATITLSGMNIKGDFAIDFGLSETIQTTLQEDFSHIFEIEELDHPPRALVRIPPLYPEHARQRGIEGIVELRFIVNTDGKVSDIQVIQSQPTSIFDTAAKRAIARWQFKPGLKNGKPVNTRVRLPLKFEIK